MNYPPQDNSMMGMNNGGYNPQSSSNNMMPAPQNQNQVMGGTSGQMMSNIIIGGMGGGGGTHCAICGTKTQSISRKRLGCTAWTWSIVLLFTFPILTCVPCCCQNCKDTEVVCAACPYVKNTIKAPCCG